MMQSVCCFVYESQLQFRCGAKFKIQFLLKMSSSKNINYSFVLACFLIASSSFCHCQNLTANLLVNASDSRPIPDTLLGIFFEEINHAGAGGLWAELVSNRGFEAGGFHTPSNIDPWGVIGDESSIRVSTDFSSCFERNKVALHMKVLCDDNTATVCPDGGVGVYNPGYWGMNIEEGKIYKVILYTRSLGAINVSVSLTSSDGSQVLASSNIISDESVVIWTKMEVMLNATDSVTNARLQLTTNKIGEIWFDQVSAMPNDTHMGHGFRTDLMDKLNDLEPRFIRFPGGCFVEGNYLRNAFRWKETVGPWENRPGHFGDVWMYWTDDGLGYFEFLQLAEDLGAAPVWIINNGFSLRDEVPLSTIAPFVQETLDSIEFARGATNSTWGYVRAAMGHPEPFDLKYVAIGNEECGKANYRANYLKYYSAIRKAYPDIKIITNCEAYRYRLDHPAHLYDFHRYLPATRTFDMNHIFDKSPRNGPKAFVSEYAVRNIADTGKGSLLAALAEAAFLLGVERNSDHVVMASYAPLFVNDNDRRWNPDAIVFNSSQVYGTPSYWMQLFFKRSSGSTLLQSVLQTNLTSVEATSISWENPNDGETYILIKVVNFGSDYVNLTANIVGLDANTVNLKGSGMTVLTSDNVMDENSFQDPTKVVPVSASFEQTGTNLNLVLEPYSLTCFDLLKSNSSSIGFDVSVPNSSI
ncbi:LOW QUALITY PROTEIN: uncharacterized protein [Phyllobates terribilis]|uniref:LOW QUALITY PROTEIN: uncharacterized protein n=1 Tax=Phyllobates terribilis TaxID=111132 RepID=UPI003CCB2CEF